MKIRELPRTGLVGWEQKVGFGGVGFTAENKLRSEKGPEPSQMPAGVYSRQRCLIKPYSQLVCPFKDTPGIFRTGHINISRISM